MDVSVVSGGDPETEYEVTLDLALIKLKISRAQAKCSRRGLSQSAAWLAETSFAIRETQLPRGRSSRMRLFIQCSVRRWQKRTLQRNVEEEEAEKERKVSSLQRKLKQPLNIKSF